MDPQRIQQVLLSGYQTANRRTGGRLEIIRRAIVRFHRVRGGEAAASIAFYAVFSLFPLLLFLTSVVGYILANVEASSQVLNIIIQTLPVTRRFIEENFNQILEQRTTGGLIGLAGLLWAASGVFLTVSRNINRAWPTALTRNFVQGRLIALAMIVILTILIILALATTAALNLLPLINVPIEGSNSIYNTTQWKLVSSIVPWFLAFGVFLGLYRWIPNTRVRWSEAFWGAIVATILWETITSIFAWIIGRGLVRYELVYGSFGTSVAILSWVYTSAVITLFGAHLSASVAAFHQSKEQFFALESTQPSEHSVSYR